MAKIKTDTQKRLNPKKQIFSNKTIVLIKIATACILLLGCSLFFFANLNLFWSDLKKFNPFPVVFFAGLLWTCIYVVNLAGHIDNKDIHHADRYDWLYKIVFTVTVMSVVLRTFLGSLNVPPAITIICIISGVMTLLTPKLLDNNNDEF